MKTFTIITLLSFSFFLSAKSQNTFPSTGNVGIGTLSPTYSLTVKGRVYGFQDTTLGSGLNVWQSANGLQLHGTGGTLSNQFQMSGINTNIDLNMTGNFADLNATRPSNFTGIFATSPQTAYPLSYTGIITSYYGLLLESSNAASRSISGQITHPYGIYQSGTSDVNYFAGKVGIGTTTPSALLTVYNGTTTGTYTTAGWVSSSDGRLKTNVNPIVSAMDIINKLNGVYFTWKSGNTDERQLGFIAQDVKKVLPEAVTGKEGDLSRGESLSMGYQNIVPVLVEALKEKDVQITALSKRLDSLQNVIIRKLNRLDSTTSAANFKLGQNVPNPFTGQTLIPYTINKNGYVL
ncbi:tail fiber domain-containing protein [Flavitalea flava]